MMVALCSDKGAPGVTTLAMVLSLVWPGGATVLEADPSGSDLTFRLQGALNPAHPFLASEPSIFTLAADARTGLVGDDVARYGQVSTLGARVIPGPLRAEAATSLRPLWPVVARQVAQAPDLVFADLGRVQPGHASWALAQAATAVLIVARPDPEGLYHLRERIAQMAHDLGGGATERNPVAVVMLAPARQHRTVLQEVEHMLRAAALPIAVAGWMAEDRAAVERLRRGEMTRALGRSALIGSAEELAASLSRLWPSLHVTEDSRFGDSNHRGRLDSIPEIVGGRTERSRRARQPDASARPAS